jgi:hypothetical protein
MSEERTLTDGSPVTPDHREINPNTGMQKAYVVLSALERAKGFVRPLRYSYVHIGHGAVFNGNVQIKAGDGCGAVTRMNGSIAETYARNPNFYNGTFCVKCRAHFPLDEFVWDGTSTQLGS